MHTTSFKYLQACSPGRLTLSGALSGYNRLLLERPHANELGVRTAAFRVEMMPQQVLTQFGSTLSALGHPHGQTVRINDLKWPQRWCLPLFEVPGTAQHMQEASQCSATSIQLHTSVSYNLSYS